MEKLFFCILFAAIFVFHKTASQTIEDSNGDWGEWSPCSRSCGVGVMYHNRTCADVTDGGALCPEPRREYRTCNIQDCPEGSGNFRYEQCARYNNETLEGKKYNWVPYIPERDLCGLNCMPKGEYFYYQWAPNVVDGTRCRPESYDICVNGNCEPVGCDLIINSTAKEDKCRVCNGNNENCRTITGEYSGTGGGYKEFLVLPRSATNILITESEYLGHFLALSDEKGNFFFNGDYEISNPKTFKIAGSLFRYERSSKGLETIRSLGPTTEPVHALALLIAEGKSPSIMYEFSVPKSVKVLPKLAEYKWKTSDYGACSKSCAGGSQVRDVYCVRDRDQKVVVSNECDPATQPENSRTCNTHSCEPRWFISGWGHCSVTCGQGIQVRRVHCEHIVAGGETVMIPDDRCTSSKPYSKRGCKEQDYCPTWSSSRWSQCSASCGEGQVTRDVTCQDVHGNVVSESSCDENTRPKTTERCNPGPCSVKWTATKWSECYPRCGEGISTRMVYCVSAVDEKHKYPSTLCNKSTKPADTKRCSNKGECAALWHGSQWSRCTSSCGTGMQMRNVICAIQEAGGILRIVPRNNCNASYVMPTIRKCISRPCHAGWYIHAWKPCSKSCGIGVTTRDVTCVADGTVVKDERWCDKKTKPTQFDICTAQNCGVTSPTTSTQTDATRKRVTVGDPDGTTKAATTTAAPTTTEPITQATTTETPTESVTEKAVITDATTKTPTEEPTTQAATTQAQATSAPVTTEIVTTDRETPTTQERTTTQKATETPTTTEAATETVSTAKPTPQEATTQKRITTQVVTQESTPTQKSVVTQDVTTQATEEPDTTQEPSTETATTTQEKVKQGATTTQESIVETQAVTEKVVTTQGTTTELQRTQEQKITTDKPVTEKVGTTQAVTTETKETATQAATTKTPETTQTVTETPDTQAQDTTTKIPETTQTVTETPVTQAPTTTQDTTTKIPETTQTVTETPVTQAPTNVQDTTTTLITEEATTQSTPTETEAVTEQVATTQPTFTEKLQTITEKIVTTLRQIFTEKETAKATTEKVKPTTRATPRIRFTRNPPVTKYVPTLPVIIIQEPKNIVTYTDSEVLMRCRATGIPTPRITWRKGMMPISYLGDRFQVLEDGTLKIVKVTTQDEEKYTCFASNFVSPMVNASATLTVVVPVDVAIDPANNADVIVGEELVLKCEARGKPTPSITWYKDGQIVSLSGQGTSHTLTIKTASFDNSGTYECRASNKYSQESAIVLINVKGEVPTPVDPKTDELCTDNNSLADCILAKKIGFCKNDWYKRACCITCSGSNK